ncbi:MAG: regulator of sigma E protease [Parcubacteria group bacterium Gr01-1014_8]|nr:MAG: regulator of sigma E protease [Parcubacteria group bacterium Gr01-1014_8]
MTTALLVIGILVFLIVVHEFGHFAAAKIFRVRVEEFGVGYPPRAFLIVKFGDTEYTLNWIPFGGFVRLYGESEAAPKVRGSFIGSPRYVQALILVAGVLMNAVAAWVLFAGALYVGIPHAVPSDAKAENVRLLVSTVVDGSPAAASEIRQGDEIMSITDEKGKSPALNPEAVVEFVGGRGGEALEITYLRGLEKKTVIVHPAHAVLSKEANRPALGVGLVMVTSDPVPAWEALKQSLPITADKLWSVFQGLGGMITNAFRGASVLEGVVGPVGLVGVVGNAAQHGFGSVLILAGFISLNLAVVNLLPVPALDGGRLVLLGVEALMQRNAPKLAVHLLNTLGVGLIIVLMVAVTYNDIVRLVG